MYVCRINICKSVATQQSSAIWCTCNIFYRTTLKIVTVYSLNRSQGITSTNIIENNICMTRYILREVITYLIHHWPFKEKKTHKFIY